MKNKLKYGLTLAALTFLVGCSDKGSIQRPSIGSGPTVQDSSSITSSKTSTSSSNNSSSSGDSSIISSSDSTDSNTSDTTSDSTSSEIDPFELSSYQYYPLPDKTLAIAVGNNKYLEKLTLPEQYQGRKVTQIVENGFKDCKALREISIPSSVLAIGYAAFSGCSSLTSIVIPEGVTTIGYAAFSGCSSLTSIVIPEGVTNIGAHAFEGCTSLTSVVIPDGVTNIGYLAFSGCSSLTGIVIPEGVTTIGATAFYNCSSLTIYCQAQSRPSGWDDNWVGYGRPVVWGCIRAGNQDGFEYAISSIEGVESATITGYTGSDTSIAVPETIGGVKVTAIANSAFAGCTSLTSIVIPESMTSIGRFAFSGCTSLTSIVIPESVDYIGAGTFYDCSSLTICCQAQSKPSGWDKDWNYSNRPVVWGCSGIGALGSLNYRIDYKNGEESITIFGCAGTDSEAVIPEKIGGIKVTAIADSAFEGCTSLTSVVIPEGVTNIGDSAFKGCSNLTICCKAKSEPGGWSSSWNPSYRPVVWGYIRAGDQDRFEYAVSSIDGVECATITGYAGSDTGIAVPETIGGIKVAAIANSAFAGCTFLTSIAIPDGVTNIGYAAFYGCSSLASIAIPNSVTNIGDYSFWGCSSLTSIAIPNSVTNIGDYSFWGCSSLTSIAIPNSVTNIGDYSFWGCSSLTSIAIPNSVRAIGEYAFRGCSRLTICCKAQSKPSGWDDNWNSYGCPVVWGYSGNGTSGSLN